MVRTQICLPLALLIASVSVHAVDTQTYDLSLRAKSGTIVKSNIAVKMDIGEMPLSITAALEETYNQDKESKMNSVSCKFTGGLVEVMGESMKEPVSEFKVEFAKDGMFKKIIEIEVPKPEDEAMGMSAIMYFQAMSASIHPGKSVAVGATWKAEISLPEMQEKYPSADEDEEKDDSKLKVSYTLSGLDKVGEISCAKVSFEGDSDEKDGIKTSGSLWIDPSNGVVIKKEFNVEMGEAGEGIKWTFKTNP